MEKLEILSRKLIYSLTKKPNKIIKRNKLKRKNAVHLKLGYRTALNDVYWEIEKLRFGYKETKKGDEKNG